MGEWGVGGGSLVVSEFFDRKSNFFREGGVFFYKVTRSPNLTFFFFGGGGGKGGKGGGKGEGEGKCTCMNKFSNGTSTLQGEHLCEIILKSMHKCRSYDPDKSGCTHAPAHNARTYSLAKG